MRRGSIKRPLLIYAVLFTVGISLAVATVASVALLRATRRVQIEALARDAQNYAQRAAWPEVGRVILRERGRNEPRIRAVGPDGVTLGIDLATARQLAAHPDRTSTLGAFRVTTGETEAYVVYQIDPSIALAAARPEIQTLLVFALSLALLFGLLLASLLSRLVLAPLGDLQLAASAAVIEGPLATGDTSAPNEVSEVAHTFRRTLRKLAEERRELERQKNELERMQDQLVRASKLASVGRLAAGVAHEIGNPLAAVLGYLDLMRRGLGPEETRDALERSTRELNRINDIIRKLLAYARADEPREPVQPMATGLVVADALVLVRGHPLLRGIELVDGVEPKSEVDALGRPGPLGQVLVNLLINAAHALNARAGAGARIEVRRRYTEREVELSVIDNGPGIPAALRDQVFDPFFTTKPPGEGTGLGLAVSRSLMEAMQGDLSVTDSPSEGATFTLRLPRAS
ncbi:MAG: hypothetical protein IT384_00390 [Deltaproteobacteria bacterium]|nr:hypothetical protein [Deltaproteobacteria bacterium]